MVTQKEIPVECPGCHKPLLIPGVATELTWYGKDECWHSKCYSAHCLEASKRIIRFKEGDDPAKMPIVGKTITGWELRSIGYLTLRFSDGSSLEIEAEGGFGYNEGLAFMELEFTPATP